MLSKRRVPETVVAAGRWVLVAGVTALEVAALSLWLPLVEGAAPLSRSAVVGGVVLLVGLQVEQFLTDLAVNGCDIGFPLGQTLAVSVTEAALWVGWFALAAALGGLRGLFVAGVALAVALSVQHAVEVNALRARRLARRLFDPATVGFSLFTAAGATVWLALWTPVAGTAPLASAVASVGLAPATVGVAALATTVFAERVLLVRLARQRRDETTVRLGYRRRSGVRIR